MCKKLLRQWWLKVLKGVKSSSRGFTPPPLGYGCFSSYWRYGMVVWWDIMFDKLEANIKGYVKYLLKP